MLKTAVKMATPLGALPARRHQFDRNADGITGTFLRLFARFPRPHCDRIGAGMRKLAFHPANSVKMSTPRTFYR